MNKNSDKYIIPDQTKEQKTFIISLKVRFFRNVKNIFLFRYIVKRCILHNKNTVHIKTLAPTVRKKLTKDTKV